MRNSEYVSGYEAVQFLEIREIEFVSYVRRGLLQPYDERLRPVPTPTISVKSSKFTPEEIEMKVKVESKRRRGHGGSPLDANDPLMRPEYNKFVDERCWHYRTDASWSYLPHGQEGKVLRWLYRKQEVLALNHQSRMQKKLSGHKLVELHKINPWELVNLIIVKKMCPLDPMTGTPILPPGAAGRLDEIRLDIAHFLERGEVKNAEKERGRLKKECLIQWEIFAAHYECHEHMLMNCPELDEGIKKDAIEFLLNSIYLVDETDKPAPGTPELIAELTTAYKSELLAENHQGAFQENAAMETFSGRELLEHPYNLTKREIWAHVKEGRLVPWESSAYPYVDPTGPKGCRRVVPIHLEGDYRKLCSRRESICWYETWLARSDEENRKFELEILKGDEEYRKRVRSENKLVWVEIEERRKVFEQECERQKSEISTLADKLLPAVVWRNLNFSPKQQEELFEKLLESYYLESEVERLFPSTAQAAPEPVAETQEQKPPSGTKEIFRCDPGTQWNQIFITLMSDETVRIKTPRGEGRFTYQDLGFEKRTKRNNPIAIWETLKLFCKIEGTVNM